MDGHGQIGPNKGDYESDVLSIASILSQGTPVYVLLADRMTSYPLMITRRFATTSEIEREQHANDVFIAHAGKGAYWFNLDGYAAPAYVADKLGFTAAGDGEVVAEFINRLTRAMTLTVVQ